MKHQKLNTILVSLFLLVCFCSCEQEEVKPANNVLGLTVQVGNMQKEITANFADATADNYYGEFTSMKNFWAYAYSPTGSSPTNRTSLWYFVDTELYNAFALQQNGYIVVGPKVYREAKLKYGFTNGPVAILAHEFGHQLQYSFSFIGSGTIRGTSQFTELEADGFAGFYLQRGKALTWTAAATFFDNLASMGTGIETAGDPSFHGTPEQRRAAGRCGFLIGTLVYTNAYGQLNWYTKTPQDVDALFYYYYPRVILGDSFTTARTEKPAILVQHPEIEAAMNSKLDELRKIATGEITGDAYVNLN